MEFPVIFWSVVTWMTAWAVIGSVATRRRYLRHDLDTSNASLLGAMLGAGTGPIGLIPLWLKTPEITNRLIVVSSIAAVVLVQAFSWLPQVGNIAAMRSFVIVVLGGLGSLPGAFVDGILVGLVEAAGTGCIPDPQKAASYIPAYGMIVLTLTLLLRPTGLFGRRFASGAHGKF